jgi:hypothetical protein
VALGSIVIAIACAGLALTAPRRNLAGDALILMCVMAFGQSLVVSPLSTAVMTSEDDRDAIVGSGVNNAISRSAWLLSVAAMGTVAAFVFRWTIAGSAADGLGLSFGVAPGDALPGDVDLARRFASDAAYSAIGWITAGMAALSAIVAAATLGWGRRLPLVAAKPEESPSGENRAL